MPTSRIHGAVLAGVVLLAEIGSAAQVASPSPNTLSASYSNEHILVTVSDGAGNPVPAPAKDSLLLRIHGESVEIEEIRSLKDSPLVFSMLVDVSGSTQPFADKQIAAASRLFRELTSAGAHGYLLLFNSKVATVDHFVDADTADKTLRKFAAPTRNGMTALYDSVIRATTQLSSGRDLSGSRRAIFLFSDGGDDHSHKSLDATIETTQNQGIPIFAIGFDRSGASEVTPEMRDGRESLKALSRSTGGSVSFLDDRGDVADRLVHLVDGQCLVSFKRPALKPKKHYGLKTESTVREIRILAPTEYFLP